MHILFSFVPYCDLEKSETLKKIFSFQQNLTSIHKVWFFLHVFFGLCDFLFCRKKWLSQVSTHSKALVTKKKKNPSSFPKITNLLN